MFLQGFVMRELFYALSVPFQHIDRAGPPAQEGLLATRFSTTHRSANVLISPRLSSSFSAILRSILRMILPERVFGSPGAH